MPSIPQSLLWISLVVLWLFVLVPMLINKRDTVRRTSDVALATRVLNSGRSRLARRGGPATGHRHDPHWQRDDDLEDEVDAYQAEDFEQELREAMQEARIRSHTRSVMVVAAVAEEVSVPAAGADTDYLDVDVVDENSGALPVGGGVQDSLFGDEEAGAAQTAVETAAEAPGVEEAAQAPEAECPISPESPEVVETSGVEDPGGWTDDEYEYIDDTSGLEAEEEVPVLRSSRRRRLESTTAAAVSARKYRFRKRVLTAMAAVMVLTAALSFTVSPALWWSCGAAAGVMVLYLAYLRRQTRIEEQVRRRRRQRSMRVRAGEEFAGQQFADRDADADFGVPSRIRRPGAVVLDIDDEDPTFEHLDEVAFSRRYDLPRAAGQ